jgi:hypothetical protein
MIDLGSRYAQKHGVSIGNIVGWSTKQQARMYQVRFPMRALDLWVEIILPTTLGPGIGWAPNRNEHQESSLGSTDNLTAICEPIV